MVNWNQLKHKNHRDQRHSVNAEDLDLSRTRKHHVAFGPLKCRFYYPLNCSLMLKFEPQIYYMSDPKLKFKTTLLQAKKTATGVEVPEHIVEKLAAGKRAPVKVTINGYTYRNTIAVMNGMYMLSVSADVRAKSGVAGGDKIEVQLELDREPREVEVPADLQKALSKNAAAKQFFETLSNSNKKRFTIPIEQAKTPETRNRRIEKAISELSAQKKV